MSNISKSFSLVLMFIIAISSVIMVNPAFSESFPSPPPQSIPKPSVPEFNLKLVDHSYDVPAYNYTDPYSGKTTTYTGYHVYNATIDITIKNQAFTPYTIPYNSSDPYYTGQTVQLLYDIQMKGHFDDNWQPITYLSDGYLVASNSEYTVFSYPWQGLNETAQVDFQVEAMIGYVHRFPVVNSDTFTGEESGWSNTQTITIPATSTSTSTSPTPAPTVPEFSPLAILPLLIFVLCVAVVLRRRKLEFPRTTPIR